MKIPSKLPSLFIAFSVVLSAAPQAAFAQVNARPVIAPAVLPTFSPLSMLTPKQTDTLSLTQSVVSGVMPLAVSNFPTIAAPISAPRAIVNPAMTELTSNVARFTATAQIGTSAQEDRQISNSMFTGSTEKGDQTEAPVVVEGRIEDGPDQEVTRLNQILDTNGIKFPAASTPYEKLAALFEKSKGVISKSDLVGWHVGRYFNEPTSSDAKRAVFIGAIADEVKDGGPIFGKALKVSAIPLRDYEKEEAMSPEVINNVMERFIQNNAAVFPGLKVTYDIKPKESLGSLVTIHAEIRKLGKYLILKQEETSINDGVFYAKGIYKSTIYAYFFKDVTPPTAETHKPK